MDVEDEETANNPSPLPSELVIEILSRVPPKPVWQFKCVSKEWLNIIKNPSFIKRHVSNCIRANSGGTLIIHYRKTLYTLDFQDPNFHATELHYPENTNLPQPDMFGFLGSCNGLLCIKFNDEIALYNPITRAHKIIPEYKSIVEVRRVVYEKKPQHVFAYDCITDDYKILRFEMLKLGQHNVRGTLLYSLSTNSWEIIENPNWIQDSVQFRGVVANNSIYWMDKTHVNIKCFDLFSRRFYEMPLPEKISPDYFPKLAVLAGRLYIVTFYFHIWKLEDYDEQEFKWTRVFRCPSSQWSNMYKLASGYNWGAGFSLACSKDGRKILVARVCGPLNFICCDLESQEATIFDVPGLNSTWKSYSAILPWVGSLVPLSD